MRAPQVTGLSDDGAKDALVGVLAKTNACVGAGFWDRRLDVDGVSRGTKGRKRILADDGDWACYHAMTRTVAGTEFFDDVEKEALKALIWKLARFCRVRILTYAVMGNHFHVLLELPDKAKLIDEFAGEEGEKRLLKHVRCLYSGAAVQSLELQLKDMRENGREADAKAVVDSILARMGDLSCYMKEVKERFTRWYNKRRGRKGTLWMDRFKSVIVGNGEALRTMGMYIDLNAVRAEIVDDPAKYRWCGWGEALGGSRRAKRGICRLMECALDSWERGRKDARVNYGAALGEILLGESLGDGREDGSAASAEVLDRSVTTSATLRGGVKGVARLLLRRVRYFTDGGVIGTKEFVEKIFGQNREKFPEGRKHASRAWRDPNDRMKRADFELHSLRDLRVDVYEEWIRDGE